jgi:hypothetical protein
MDHITPNKANKYSLKNLRSHKKSANAKKSRKKGKRVVRSKQKRTGRGYSKDSYDDLSNSKLNKLNVSRRIFRSKSGSKSRS